MLVAIGALSSMVHIEVDTLAEQALVFGLVAQHPIAQPMRNPPTTSGPLVPVLLMRHWLKWIVTATPLPDDNVSRSWA